jgi:hypothetical protein
MDIPWSQIITALAAIGGGVTVGLLNRWNQRTQFEQQERVRYHESRIDAYAQLISAGDVLINESLKDPNWDDTIVQLNTRFSEAGVKAELLAGDTVRPVIAAYVTAATDLRIGFMLWFKGERPDDEEFNQKRQRMFDADNAEYKQCRTAFIEAARQERSVK